MTSTPNTMDELREALDLLTQENKLLKNTISSLRNEGHHPEEIGARSDFLKNPLYFQKIINSMYETLTVIDSQGDFLFSNTQASHNLSGGTLNDIAGKNIRDFISGEQAQKLIGKYQQVITNQTSDQQEIELQMDGGTKWFLNTLEPIEFGPDKINAVLSMSVNITRLKLAEKDLKESEEKYQLLADSTFEAIFISQNGICLGQNKTAEEMFGYSYQEALGKPGIDWIAPDYREMVKKNMQTPGVMYYEAFALRKNGSTFPCEIKAKTIEYKGSNLRITALRDLSEKHNADKLINQTETKYHGLIETTSEGFWLLDEYGITKDVNESLCKMIGYSKAEMIGKSPLWFFDEENQRILKSEMSQISHTVHRNYEITAIKKDGSRITVLSNATTLKDETGKLIGSFSMIKDISELKEKKTALKESEANLSAVLESSKDGIWSVDRNFKILTVNSRFKKDFRRYYGAELKKGVNIIDFVSPEEREKWIRRYKTVLKGQPLVEIEEYDLDSDKFFFEIKLYPIWDNQVITGISVISTDITQSRKSEIALKESEQRYRLLSDNASDAIALYDKNYHFLYLSPANETLTGYTLAELNKISFIELVHPDDREKITNIIWNETRQKIIQSNNEYRIIHKKGHTIWVETNSKRLYDQKGEMHQMITVNRDITQRKQAEETLEDKNRKFELLSQSATKMLDLPDVNSIFKYIINSIHKLYPTTLILINSVDETNMMSTLVHVVGLEKSFLQKAIKGIGFNPIEKPYKLLPTHFEYYKSGNFTEFPNGLASFAGSEFPSIAASFIQKLFGVHKIYTIGINKESRLLSTMHMFTLNKSSITDGEFIESFVKQAGIVIQRKMMEEELKFQANVLDQIQDKITATDLDGNITYVNKAVANMLKKDFSKIVNQNVTIFGANPLRGATQEQLIHNTLKYGEWRSEVANLDPDGNEIIVDVRTSIFTDTQNKPMGLIGISTDITKQKQAEIALKESESKYRILIETASDSIYLLSDQGIFLEVNQSACNFLGKNRSDIIGQPFSIMDPTFNKNDFMEFWEEKPYLEQVIFETRHFKFDGNLIDVEVSGQKYKIHDKTYFYGISRDISERKAAEQALLHAKEKAVESEHKIRSMFENTLTGMLFCDPNGNILEMNSAAIAMLGSPSVEDSRKINLLHYERLQKAGFSDNLIKCLSDKTIITDKGQYVSQFGKTLFIHYYLIPILMNNRIIGVWANLHDLTDLWQTQNDLISAKERAEESDRLKSAFLANMSHEIRTPMNGILGFAELLKEPDLSGFEQMKYIEVIERSGQRMLSIINDIVEISKIESGLMETHLTETNINEQLDFIEDFFRHEVEAKGMELIKVSWLPAQHAVLKTDSEKVYAILINLVKNAIKYTSHGSVTIGCVKKDAFLEFMVKDTGQGIPNHQQAKIFERFIQSDTAHKKPQEGAGLGLSIARAYVEMLGGNIWLESEVGKGTTFYFTIPAET